MHPRPLVRFSLLLAALLWTVPASAAVFLKLDGVPGESRDETHKDAIVIESWSFGATNAPASAGGGGGAGKVSFSDLHLTKRLDKSSPLLYLRAASGTHIKEAVLHVRKSGDTPVEYYTVTLTDVLVTSVQTSGQGDSVPMESFSLNFTKIEWTYKETVAGGAGGTVRAGWDRETNVTF